MDQKGYNSPDAVGLQGHGVEDEGLGEGGLGGPQPRPEVVQVEQVHGRLRVAHLHLCFVLYFVVHQDFTIRCNHKSMLNLAYQTLLYGGGEHSVEIIVGCGHLDECLDGC